LTRSAGSGTPGSAIFEKFVCAYKKMKTAEIVGISVLVLLLLVLGFYFAMHLKNTKF
jgi:hypothetical protein